MTFNEAFYPVDRSVRRRTLSLFLKRLRWLLAPIKIRYFGVGEYGPQTMRAHYHAAIFGAGPEVLGGNDGQGGLVQRAWSNKFGDSMGFTMVGPLDSGSAGYVAGYLTAKVLKKDECESLGIEREFSTMSKNGGLGASAMVDVAAALMSIPGELDPLEPTGDVPIVLAHGKTKLPLGRYLRGRLRRELGFGDVRTPAKVLQAQAAELRVSFGEAFKKAEEKSVSLQAILKGELEQKCLNVESKFKAKSKGRVL